MLVEVASPLERAGLESVLLSRGGMEIVHERAEADVLITDHAGSVDAQIPVVLLGPEGHNHWTAEALRSGVRAALPRDAAPGQIAAAVEAAAAGLVAILPEDLESLPLLPHAGGVPGILTAREAEVLTLMAEGFSNKEIAYRLGISDHTVKFHVASILGKLHAASRTEAVSVGLRNGLVML